VAAVPALLLDLALKTWLVNVYDLGARGTVQALPFLDLLLHWNRGISYGLFQQESDLGRWALVAFKIVASIALWLWLARAPSRIAAVSIGLIIGGALGNALDRVLYGAVADFFSLHAFGLAWPYLFNVADMAIVAGVIGLLYDSFRTSHAASR